MTKLTPVQAIEMPCCKRLRSTAGMKECALSGVEYHCGCSCKLFLKVTDDGFEVLKITKPYTEVMNIYRLSIPDGEALLHIPEKSYHHPTYDYVRHHFHQRFRAEVNTSIENILGFDLTTYDRKSDQFGCTGEHPLMYVGHVTMDEWNTLGNGRSDQDRMEDVFKIIEERTGVKRREQFRTGDHGPDYWDCDAEENLLTK